MKWTNKVNRFFDSLFYSERDNNKNLDGKVYVESTEDGAVILSSIATKKRFTKYKIIFTMLVDNQVISEAKFTRLENNKAGKLICQTKYKLTNLEPVLIVEQAESREQH